MLLQEKSGNPAAFVKEEQFPCQVPLLFSRSHLMKDENFLKDFSEKKK
jgi:hypothetical protein